MFDNRWRELKAACGIESTNPPGGRKVKLSFFIFLQKKPSCPLCYIGKKNVFKNKIKTKKMRGINKVTLIGNAGNVPEYKTLKDETPVAKFSMATTETYRLKDGETQSHTEWHTIIVWRGLATLANQYIHKGSLLYIEGKLRSRQYEDKDGQKKYVTEIVAEQLILLDKKNVEES